MRKIAANYLIPVITEPIKNGIIVIDSKSIITDIIDTGGDLKEQAGLEFYNGVLIPELLSIKKPEEACIQVNGFRFYSPPVKDENPDESNDFSAFNPALSCIAEGCLKQNQLFNLLHLMFFTFRDVPFQELLRCFTINPSVELGIASEKGILQEGVTSHINLIAPFDFSTFGLLKESILKSLV